MKINTNFASSKPKCKVPSIEDVIFYNCQGPFKTKIDADLFVVCNLANKNVNFSSCIPEGLYFNDFLKHEKSEESLILKNLQKEYPNFKYGLNSFRLYFQKNMLPKDIGAGNEFHRLRKEIAFVIEGNLEGKFEDIYGNLKELNLNSGKAIIIPPFIMHSLKPIERTSAVFIANTGFYYHHNKEIVEVRDTYSRDIFEKLKENCKV